MFQSTPDYLNRENDKAVDCTGVPSLFQSTPDYLNRENFFLDAGFIRNQSFNPLPII